MKPEIVWKWIQVVSMLSFVFIMGTLVGLDVAEQTCENRIDAIYQSHGLDK